MELKDHGKHTLAAFPSTGKRRIESDVEVRTDLMIMIERLRRLF